MKLRLDRPRHTIGWTGFAILIVGILIGLLSTGLVEAGLHNTEPLKPAARSPAKLEAYLLPHPGSTEAEAEAAEADNGLETLAIEFDSAAAATLQRVRTNALARGMIIQTDADTVKGRVGIGTASSKAEIRIKGDWTDHVNTDKWSLRIKLKKSKINGMAVFSVQHPKTRGMLWEWLVLSAARREGLLAPRSTFVNVVLNGQPMGVYYLEEHFSKELLESQGRREGPIVLWDESVRWSALLQARHVPTKGVNLRVPKSAEPVWGVTQTEVRAYGEKRLSSIDSLSRSLYSGVEQMLNLQALVIADSSSETRLKRLEAIARIEEKTLDDLVDVDKLARMHALISLFQIDHALIWHNMRFYHDPVLDRLEPILFDCNAHRPSSRDIVLFRSRGVIEQFSQSTAYYNGVFEALADLCRPDYLDDLFSDLGDDLRRFEGALDNEFTLPPELTVAGMLQRLRTEQLFLINEIDPVDPINFHASYSVAGKEGSGAITSELVVDAWATTRTPTVLEGFRYSNGVFLPARGLTDKADQHLATTLEGGIVLPNDGRVVRLHFPMDSRLANLANVDQALAAMRAGKDAGRLDLDVTAAFHPIAMGTTKHEALTFRYVDPAWRESEGRPTPPSLAEALSRHSFLEYRPESNELRIRQGSYKVRGDLIVPSGYALHANGVRLLFEEDAVLLSDSPLIFTNITLGPQAAFDRWRGVIVLQAKGRSIWNKVTVKSTDSLSRAGWTVTGGITFYQSPVTMTDCHIDGTWAEDGTNIFGADFLMERTNFTACVSDSFDGDFVTGRLVDCIFQDGLADGVDVSGSEISIVNCQFLNMGDKGVSAGESSIVAIEGGLCDGVSLGVAAKDRSEVTVQGMTIRNARKYALTAFIKKAEFGPAHMVATGVTIQGSGLDDFLVQTDCSLEVDGELVPTRDLDVKQLYKDKVLGQ